MTEEDTDLSEDSTKSKNNGELYRLIYYDRQSSRQIISEKLGLSLPTVTNSLNQLKMEGLIYNAGSFESTGGRKANLFRCTPHARYSLGINITRKHLSIVVIDLDINIIASKRMRLPFCDTEDYYEFMCSEIEQLLDGHRIPRSKLLGAGISMPVIINADQKTISYATVIQVSHGIYERIGRPLSYPFLLFNDANSAGLAESWFNGSGQTMVYLSLCSSVGGATMDGMNVSKGSNNRSSEFGHMCIVPHGKRCYCGQYGCLDAYCSEKVLSDFTNGDLKQFFEKLKENENCGYKRVFDEYLDHLAVAVNNLRMCYDCDIVLGGNVGSYMTDYIGQIRKKALSLNPFEQNGDFIRVCHYRTEASAVGAAIYHIDCFVKSM